MGRENPRWGYLRIRGELLKLGVDVSATTIATVLRKGGLGPAPRRVGPTWTQFLRVQAYALLSPSPRSEEEDRSLEDLSSGPQEAPAPISDYPVTTERDEPIHDGPVCLGRQPIATVAARPRSSVAPVPPHPRSDGPAMAA